MRAGLAQRRLQPTTRPERDLRASDYVPTSVWHNHPPPNSLLRRTTRPERDLRPFDEQNERVFSLLWIGGAVRQVKRRTEDAKVQA